MQFFEKDVIDWQPEYELAPFYGRLFTLKKTHPALRADAELKIVAADEHRQLLVFERSKEGKSILVVINFSSNDQSMVVPGTT
ncbi:DUF3459 domain-containing protein, partial [Salmonella enterica subsp. enterica serovar Typhimurium]|nr:DUF3459 domain-containing protein [Salmonella enterica subsp. enterica serovar Typhimurium]